MTWPQRIALALAGAALVHVGTLWLAPRAIMVVVESRLSRGGGPNRIVHAPLPDESWRTIVMPSPDLLYSACAFDVRNRPLAVSAEIPGGYFSISGFADNTDNFFVINDRTAGGGHVRIVLSRDPGFRDPEGGVVVAAPTEKGVVIFRQLVLDRTQSQKAEQIQRAASCKPL